METVEIDGVENETDGVENIVISLGDLLKAWGLEEYHQNFLAQQIDLDDIMELFTPEWLPKFEKLIPVAGHRMRFKRNATQLFNSEENVDNKNKENEGGNRNSASKANEKVSNSTNLPSTPIASGLRSCSVLNSSTLNHQPSTSTTSSGDIGSTPSPNHQQSNSAQTHVVLQTISANQVSNIASTPAGDSTTKNIRKRPLNADDQPTARRRITVQDEVVTASGVDENHSVSLLLRKSGTGRCLLQKANTSTKLKSDRDQNKLADIIIENALRDPTYKIKTETFPEMVLSIQGIFPGENPDTYYIPYRKQGNVKCLAKGKLMNKYYALRKKLKACGLIVSNEENDENGDDDTDTPDVESLEHKLNFLKDNLEPWDDIVEYWRDTSKCRVRLLQRAHTASKYSKGKAKTSSSDDDSVTSVSSYISTYPALREQLGFTLLEADFDVHYPDQKLKVYSDWDDFHETAVAALKLLPSKPEALKDSLSMLENDMVSKSASQLVVLLSLCYLDSAVTVARKKKDRKIVTWRPHIIELQEGFISRIDSAAQIDTFVSKRYQKFQEWSLPVQPFCVVCGPDVETIDGSYVVLDRRAKYLVNSPIRALDVCFKIIHATHAEYSIESHRLWMLIQKELYKLDTDFDNLKSDAQLPKLLSKFRDGR